MNQETNKKLSRESFKEYLKVLNEIQLKHLYPIKNGSQSYKIGAVYRHHDRNLSTILTIDYLMELGRTADILTLSRALFESTVTMALLAKSLIPRDIERYENFQFLEIYKRHSHLKRIEMSNVSSLKPEGENNVAKKREWYIKEFGDGPNWSGNSVEINVQSLDKAIGPILAVKKYYEFLYCQIYRSGSQATHSSFAGISKNGEMRAITTRSGETFGYLVSRNPHLVFAGIHSLLAFVESIRFMAVACENDKIQKHLDVFLSEFISNGAASEKAV